MLDNNFKKAQVSDTVVWVVATLVLIFIIILFVYSSSALSRFKSITLKNSLVKSNDVILVKNSLAFFRNSTNKEIIQDWLKDE